MIYAFIAEHCWDLPVAASCRVRKVTTSGDYEWRDRQSRSTSSAEANYATRASRRSHDRQVPRASSAKN